MAATLQFRLTTNGLGGASTATQLSATALNNLFDNVTPEEAVAGSVEYRSVDIHNAGDDATTAVEFFLTETESTSTILTAALEASPIGSTTAIANEITAPTVSGSFTAYTTGSRLTIPQIAAGSYCRLWLKRTVTAGAASAPNDGTTLSLVYV